MRSFQNHRARSSSALHLQPAGRAYTPTIARLQAGESKLRHGRGKIVAQARGHSKKLLRHNAANSVQAKIVRSGVAATITIKASHGLATAGFQRLPEDIFLRCGLCGRHTKIVVEKGKHFSTGYTKLGYLAAVRASCC